MVHVLFILSAVLALDSVPPTKGAYCYKLQQLPKDFYRAPKVLLKHF
jgi:hypothetical protein